MRILITNNTLSDRAGSELYVRDLATALLARGHSPVAFSTVLGDVAEELRAATVPVIDDLNALSCPPDVIHGHHHVETMIAVLHFPTVPAISYCHGWIPWEEAPPRFPTIRRYVAVDEPCRDRLTMEHGIPAERVRLLLNFVDLARFEPRGPLPDRPRKALVFSNSASDHNYVPAVREACARAGLSLEVAGGASGRIYSRPEASLGQFDIVFAKARAALEALAVGTAVVLCDAPGLGPMVTSDELGRLRPLNFGIRTLRNPVTAPAVEREIARYDPADAAEVSRRIRACAGRDAAVEQVLALYAEVVEEHRGAKPWKTEEIARAASAYLRSLSARLKERDRLKLSHGELLHRAEQLDQDRGRLEAELGAAMGERDRRRADRDALLIELQAMERTATWRLRCRLRQIPLLGRVIEAATRFAAPRSG